MTEWMVKQKNLNEVDIQQLLTFMSCILWCKTSNSGRLVHPPFDPFSLYMAMMILMHSYVIGSSRVGNAHVHENADPYTRVAMCGTSCLHSAKKITETPRSIVKKLVTKNETFA